MVSYSESKSRVQATNQQQFNAYVGERSFQLVSLRGETGLERKAYLKRGRLNRFVCCQTYKLAEPFRRRLDRPVTEY